MDRAHPVIGSSWRSDGWDEEKETIVAERPVVSDSMIEHAVSKSSAGVPSGSFELRFGSREASMLLASCLLRLKELPVTDQEQD